MTIKMNSIASTSISEVGYRYRTMNVKFANGKLYEFKKVPRAQYDSFLSSVSKGKFFNDKVKDKYTFLEIA